MKQRRWTSEEKLAIVMAGFKGSKSVANICKKHQISQALYYRWHGKFLLAYMSPQEYKELYHLCMSIGVA